MTVRLAALFLVTALLGFLIGARAVGVPHATASERAPSEAGAREPDPVRGSFWRPAGSDARRPVVTLEPVAWKPPETRVGGARPDALAAMQAVVRLASLD